MLLRRTLLLGVCAGCGSGVDDLRLGTDSRSMSPFPALDAGFVAPGDETAGAPNAGGMSFAGRDTAAFDSGDDGAGGVGLRPDAEGVGGGAGRSSSAGHGPGGDAGPAGITGAGGASAPGWLVQVPVQPSLVAVSAAVWEPAAARFVLLDDASGVFYLMDPTAPDAFEGPFPVPAGVLAGRALAASDDTVFLVVDGAIWRLAPDGAPIGSPVPLQGSPDAQGLTMAYAHGTLLVADPSGPAQVLLQGGDEMQPIRELDEVNVVCSDGEHFLALQKRHPTSTLHVVLPELPEPHPAPCTVPSGADIEPTLLGTTVAWTERSGLDYVATFATVGRSSCSKEGSFVIGTLEDSTGTVGLLTEESGVALTGVSRNAPQRVDLVQIDRTTGVLDEALRSVRWSGNPAELRLVTAPPAFVLLLTGGPPLLFSVDESDA